MLCEGLNAIGIVNVQYIVKDGEIYVIEVNPRSSRTVPYISKVTGIPIVDLATEVILGKTIRELGFEPGLQPESKYYAIKMPVFSFEKPSTVPRKSTSGQSVSMQGWSFPSDIEAKSVCTP